MGGQRAVPIQQEQRGMKARAPAPCRALRRSSCPLGCPFHFPIPWGNLGDGSCISTPGPKTAWLQEGYAWLPSQLTRSCDGSLRLRSSESREEWQWLG